MFRKLAPVILLSGFLLGNLSAAPQAGTYMMTSPKPSGCTQPLGINSFATTDTVAYLWFTVTGVSAGDVFATNYYMPNGQYYSAPSGAFLPTSSSGSYCFTDVPFYIAGSTPANNPGVWTVRVTANGSPLFTLSFTIFQRGASVVLSSLSPSLALAGGPGFNLSVNGSGFQSGSTVKWNSASLSTTFINSTQLVAAVPAAMISTAGTANISVVNSDGTTSATVPFTINGLPSYTYGLTRPQTPEPSDMCSNPTATNTTFSATDSAAILWFRISGINGGDSIGVSFINPSGQVDSSSYTSTIPPGVTADCETRWFYISSVSPARPAGAWTIRVTYNGATLFTTGFTITQNTPPATISSLSPSSVVAGAPGVTITVNGSGFVSGSTVQWNGTPLTTTYISSTQLMALVLSNLLYNAGNATITVVNPGSSASAGATFAVTSTQRSGVLSHIAAGGGWTTVISLLNPSTSTVTATVRLHGDDGSALSIPVTVSSSGGNQTVTSSAPGGSMSANSTLQISMGSGLSDLVTGWAEVLSSSPVTGFAIFRTTSPNSPVSEGTVPLQTQFPSSLVVPYDNTLGSSTGIALANLGTAGASITATVWDQNGTLLSTQPITLPASGHTAFGLAQQIPATAGKQGMVQFQTTSTSGVSALGLRFSSYGTFTSVPTAMMQ